jgi:hypothetical protein
MGLIRNIVIDPPLIMQASELQLISLLAGKQTYIFYGLGDQTQTVGVVEVLIDERLPDGD